jgi:demethylmenaquinone methyltransferase/2-methoxy-6-polyprenyl-1,4-benzoquinol methylase
LNAVSPPPRPEVEGWFDWLSARYEPALSAFTLGQDWRWKHELLRGLDLRPRDHVVDLACGTGLVLERLAARRPPPRRVGVDLNRAMMAVGRRRRPGEAWVQADAIRLPFRSATFDAATAAYLPKYVEPDTFAAELRRVLRPDGRVGVYDFSMPRAGLAGAGYAIYLHEVLPRIFRSESGDRSEGGLFRFLDGLARTSGWEERLPLALREAGFRRVRTRVSLGGAVTWVWADGDATEGNAAGPGTGSRGR